MFNRFSWTFVGVAWVVAAVVVIGGGDRQAARTVPPSPPPSFPLRPGSVAPTPLDWPTLWKDAHSGKSVVLLVNGVRLDSPYNAVAFFLVDGERWHDVGEAVPRGCGGERESYSFVLGLNRDLQRIPHQLSPATKFVVVGGGRPTVESIELHVD